MGACIVNTFQYIPNKMHLYTVYSYLETALHVSGGISTHHQERKQLSTASGICHTVTAICRYIANKMQLYTVYLYLETALHVSGGISTHHQERKQLYLKHLVFVTPLLPSAAIYPTICNFTQFIYIWKLLYMFRVVSSPIIRSANKCI